MSVTYDQILFSILSMDSYNRTQNQGVYLTPGGAAGLTISDRRFYSQGSCYCGAGS